jgi:hypothetical protein
MTPSSMAMSLACPTSRNSLGRIGKIRPMPTASSMTAERITISALFKVSLQNGNLAWGRKS